MWNRVTESDYFKYENSVLAHSSHQKLFLKERRISLLPSHDHVFRMNAFRKLFRNSHLFQYFFVNFLSIQSSEDTCTHAIITAYMVQLFSFYKVSIMLYLLIEKTTLMASDIGWNCHMQVSLFPFRNSVPKCYEQSDIAACFPVIEPALHIHQQPSCV